MRGKLIVIEGTDCSGKETQSKFLLERLKKEGYKIEEFGFPHYNSPTGKIIGGCYLGKPQIGESFFGEGAPEVDPKVSSLYFAADRKYNFHKISFLLENGIHVILDRYTYSNMAHQGGKLSSREERIAMYQWVEELEFRLLELPKADIRIFLHMPFEQATELRNNREEQLDQNEMNLEHLKHAELAYLELVDLYDFKTIQCNKGHDIKSIPEIHEEIYQYVINELSK